MLCFICLFVCFSPDYIFCFSPGPVGDIKPPSCELRADGNILQPHFTPGEVLAYRRSIKR